jgi:hypothetical protein
MLLPNMRITRNQRRRTVRRLFTIAGPMPWCNRCQCYHHSTAQHIPRNGRAQEVIVVACLGFAIAASLGALAAFSLMVDWSSSW